MIRSGSDRSEVLVGTLGYDDLRGNGGDDVILGLATTTLSPAARATTPCQAATARPINGNSAPTGCTAAGAMTRFTPTAWATGPSATAGQTACTPTPPACCCSVATATTAWLLRCEQHAAGWIGRDFLRGSTYADRIEGGRRRQDCMARRADVSLAAPATTHRRRRGSRQPLRWRRQRLDHGALRRRPHRGGRGQRQHHRGPQLLYGVHHRVFGGTGDDDIRTSGYGTLHFDAGEGNDSSTLPPPIAAPCLAAPETTGSSAAFLAATASREAPATT